MITPREPSKPSHVGIHWIDLAKYSQMRTHMSVIFQHFLLKKLAEISPFFIFGYEAFLWTF